MGILASWLQVLYIPQIETALHTTIQCCILFPVVVQLSTQVMINTSLVPRPSPSFPSLAGEAGFPLLPVRLTILQATGSWARAWERGYDYGKHCN